MTPGEQTFRATQTGDSWEAIVPKQWVENASSKEPGGDKSDLALGFSRAFWNTIWLKVERRVVEAAISMGVGPFALRPGDSSLVPNEFKPGALVVGGLFGVEAHDSHPPSPHQNISGPIILSWWLAPTRPSTTFSLLGGYHSLAVEPSTPKSPAEGKAEEEHVKLIFTTHLVIENLDHAELDVSSPDIPTRALMNLPLKTKAILWFHHLYSRLLVDAAVRSLRSSSSSS